MGGEKNQLFASSILVDDSMAAQKQERYVNKLKGEAAKNNEVGERNEWWEGDEELGGWASSDLSLCPWQHTRIDPVPSKEVHVYQTRQYSHQPLTPSVFLYSHNMSIHAHKRAEITGAEVRFL